ncbi:hypothetical protein OH77DRAFT_1525957 [Trametes cingulata]|nr:hypothetical protein OH77DRAFT_1525957 [Trametes cingulata]
MPSYPCSAPGCRFTGKDQRALSKHRSACKFRLPGITEALKKRAREDEDERETRKRLRMERDNAAEVEVEVPVQLAAPPATTRSGRRPRIPKRLVDYVPHTKEDLPTHLADAFPDPLPEPTPSRYTSPTVEDVEDEDVWRTPPDSFGLYREYYGTPPQRDPEATASLSSVCDAPTLEKQDPSHADSESTGPCGIPAYKTIFWLTRNSAVGVHEQPAQSDGGNQGSAGFGPFDNASQFRLYDWHYNASLTKSMDDFDNLIDVLLSRGFSVEHLRNFRAQMAQEKMDDYVHPKGVFSAEDGWIESSVEIPLPKTKARHASEAAAPTFQVRGVYHRRLTAVIRGAAEDERFADRYHWVPHKLFWVPPVNPRATRTPTSEVPPPSTQPTSSAPSESSSPQPDIPRPIRVYTDTYNSNAMLREAEELRKKPRNPADSEDVEYAIASVLLWSDSTHLTSFGSAALWPIYLYLGNLSKYIRGMPTEFAAHHLAYIPSLPDDFKDFYTQVYGSPPSADVQTFCKRELMQQIWLLLLDDEFMDAYENGILVTCGDGVVRRIFPRIFTYSADYPEKILLTALKPLSTHPCPRCLVTHDELCEAGTPNDMQRRTTRRLDTPKLRRDILRARKLVFKKGCALSSKRLKKYLDSGSLNPIQSAFSARFARFGVNFYDLFVPDLMHEFELGVWKGTFTHLLRLLAAQGDHALQEFNRRMREMPTYGRDKIRKFWRDVSTRKKLAARDYEDFLICFIPAFEGLLPQRDNQTVMDLLFELANWHALAKLRLHTDVSVGIFRAATGHMTEAMRDFARTTCERYETRELAKEVDARVRRAEKSGADAPDRNSKVVHFNVLNTYKYHSLPDYPDSVEEIGPLDNANTQVGELEHRHVKRFYARTNKINYAIQIAKHQRRAALLRALRQHDDYVPRRERLRMERAARLKESGSTSNELSSQDSDRRPDSPLPLTNPHDHHAISQTRRLCLRLHNWLAEHDRDPAAKNFIPLLRAHLLARMLKPTPADTHAAFSDRLLDGVEIQDDRIYRHKTLRVNYTTYNMRRDQDVIKPSKHPDIMVLADDYTTPDAHPFWYARVIDIFHADVRYTGPGATRSMQKWRRMEFLWVRWFEVDEDVPCGFQERQLPRLRFIDTTDSDKDPFGFLDPREVLRGAYIVPAFVHGTTNTLLPPSKLARCSTDQDEDFEYYYACLFVDRDMYMRYLGGGIGHRETGVSVTTSQQHALRRRPLGAEEDHAEPPSGTLTRTTSPDPEDSAVSDGSASHAVQQLPADDLDEGDAAEMLDEDDEDDADELEEDEPEVDDPDVDEPDRLEEDEYEDGDDAEDDWDHEGLEDAFAAGLQAGLPELELEDEWGGDTDEPPDFVYAVEGFAPL